MCFDRSTKSVVSYTQAPEVVEAPTAINFVVSNDNKVISVKTKGDIVKVVTRRNSGRLDSFTLTQEAAGVLGNLLQNAAN